MLLKDLRSIFAESGKGQLSSDEIVKYLVEMNDRPWAEMLKRRGMHSLKTWITRSLGELGVPRWQWRVPGSNARRWGLRVVDLQDAFDRYLDHSPEDDLELGDVGTS
jgi:hypothetical protein